MSGTCIGAIFYVSPAGAHNSPYDTPGKASTNIQAAVNIATNAGDKVLLLDGTNFLTSPVSISEAIIVEGVNGPDHAIINGSGITHCFELDNVACVLSGLTITNGFSAGDGGGVYCYGLSPIITNCVITKCLATDNGGGVYSGTIRNCVIRENDAGESGGGAFGLQVGCEIYNTKIIANVSVGDGGGIFGCIIYDSLMDANEARYGGGASSGDLYNCTVVGNDAQDGGGADQCNVYNSIIVSNTVSVFSGVNIGLLGEILSNTCSSASDDFVDGLDGNITADPLFVDFTAGNYRLQSGSPCINTGDNSYVLNAADLDGNPRIVGVVDMGAYEDQSFTSFPISGEWTESGFVVQWPSEFMYDCQVLWTANLTNSFSEVGPVIYHPQNSYTDTVHAAEDRGFYKVEVQLQ